MEAQPIEDRTEGIAWSPAGVADQSQSKTARPQLADDVERTGNNRRKKIEDRERISFLERLPCWFIEIELQRIEEMIDLRTAWNVFIARPIQLLTTLPDVAIGRLESRHRLPEDLGHPLETHFF